MNPEKSFQALANQPGWRADVSSWLTERLQAMGLAAPAAIELVQVRPWSIVLRVISVDETLFFKASSAQLKHEPGLTDWLYQQAPDLVVEVIAIDQELGWSLQRSAGQRVREAVAPSDLMGCWQRLLPLYANLQLAVTDQVHELLAIGLPDRRLETLPEHFRRWRAILAAADPAAGLFTVAELKRLEHISAEVSDVCLDLAELGPDPTIHHGDLHDGNVGVSEGKLRIFDWGDLSLSHPFFSLRSTFVSLENRLGLQPEAEEGKSLSRAYINAWSSDYQPERLQRSIALASQVWSMGTALSWEAALGSFENSFGSQYEVVLPSLMRELLQAFDQKIDGQI